MEQKTSCSLGHGDQFLDLGNVNTRASDQRLGLGIVHFGIPGQDQMSKAGTTFRRRRKRAIGREMRGRGGG
jgi:hypothetical protein